VRASFSLARFSAREIECDAQLLSKIDNAQALTAMAGRIPHRLAGKQEESNFEIARAEVSGGFHRADENENTGC